MLDLVKNVCIEEGLQFIVGINSKPQISSMIDVIETPKLSIYEADWNPDVGNKATIKFESEEGSLTQGNFYFR